MNQKSLAIIALGVAGGVLLWLLFRNYSSSATSNAFPVTGTLGKLPSSSGAVTTGLASAIAGLFGKAPAVGTPASAGGSPGAPVVQAGSAAAAAGAPVGSVLGPTTDLTGLNSQQISNLAYTQNATNYDPATQQQLNLSAELATEGITAPTPSPAQVAASQAAAQAGSAPPVIAPPVATPPDLSFLGGAYAPGPPPQPNFSVSLGFDAGNSSVQSFGATPIDTTGDDFSGLGI